MLCKGHHFRDYVLELAKDKHVYLEGSILKVIEIDETDVEFKRYIEFCKAKDANSRKKRLSISTQVQTNYKKLEQISRKNEKLLIERENALEESRKSELLALRLKEEAEKSKETALHDLDVMQKKRQFEMIGSIVKIALSIIIGIGLLTTGLYVYALSTDADVTIIEATWSNLFGILLTNSFSIIGTIMGVRYAKGNDFDS